MTPSLYQLYCHLSAARYAEGYAKGPALAAQRAYIANLERAIMRAWEAGEERTKPEPRHRV